jgi:hypothetical protein
VVRAVAVKPSPLWPARRGAGQGYVTPQSAIVQRPFNLLMNSADRPAISISDCQNRPIFLRAAGGGALFQGGRYPPKALWAAFLRAGHKKGPAFTPARRGFIYAGASYAVRTDIARAAQ